MQIDDLSLVGKKDAKLLKELRSRFDYGLSEWREIRAEAKLDMRFIAGDQWDDLEKAARKDEGRPCMVFDELGQYVNALLNEVRQNPHAVKVVPRGAGENDKQADVRADIIRNVEYKSNAKAAYFSGFENAAQRSYGFWRITTQYVDDKSFEQELCIKRIANPDNVIIDPDTKEADASDMKWCYVIDQVPREEFRRKYPDAAVTDFSSELMQLAPAWIKESDIQVAEYWKVKTKVRKLLQLMDSTGPYPAADPVTIYKDELKEKGIDYDELKASGIIVNERKVEERSVCQYITNGVEILEENDWAGKWIPIVPVFGRELFVDYGSGGQRVLMSLIRLARMPQKMFNYLRTQEMEEASMTPKTPFLAVEGQLENHELEWAEVGKVPKAYLQYKAMTASTGSQILPPPTRQPFVPNFAAYEQACEAVRRSIQAAMGISPLPTSAQRQNEKSGVALERIQSQQQRGSFHFIDNFLMSIEHSGRILNDMIDKIYDTARDVGVRKPDGQYDVQRIKDPNDPDSVDITGEPHDVTISTGPSFESQREEAADFADQIAKIEGVFPLIGDLLVRLRNLGPIGEEIAKRLTPPQFASENGEEPVPPAAQAKIQQMQQQAQALNAFAQELEEEKKKLEDEKAGKIVDNTFKMEIEKLKIQAQITVAEIGAKVQESLLRVKLEHETLRQAGSEIHEATMSEVDQSREAAEAERTREHESGEAQAGRSHEAQMAESGQEHESAESQADRDAAAEQAELSAQNQEAGE